MKVFGKVNSDFWIDKTLKSVSQDARYLALYLLTCSHGNMMGIYKLPIAYALADLQWNEERWSASLEELKQVGYLDYNRDEEYVSLLQSQKVASADNEGRDS